MLNKIDGYLIMSYVTLLCNSGTLKVSIIKERERGVVSFVLEFIHYTNANT